MSTMMARASLRRTVAPSTARIAAKPAAVKMAARPRAIAAARRAVVVRAAADGGAAADPYQVMGLKAGATSEQIQRAYNNLKREKKGDEAAIAAIEAAHSTLMMSQLTMRMQGKVTVESDVKFADRAQFFPWRPRVMVDERKRIMFYLAAAAALSLWVFVSAQTAFTQPLIASTGLAIVGHFLKQCQIFPTGGRYATPDEKKNVSKNLFRAAGLGLFGMFMGTMLFWTIPDAISASLGKTMPVWFYESQSIILNMGGIISNFVMVAFFR